MCNLTMQYQLLCDCGIRVYIVYDIYPTIQYMYIKHATGHNTPVKLTFKCFKRARCRGMPIILTFHRLRLEDCEF